MVPAGSNTFRRSTIPQQQFIIIIILARVEEISFFQYFFGKIQFLLFKKLLFFKTKKETGSFTRLVISVIFFPIFLINFYIRTCLAVIIIFICSIPANNYLFKVNNRNIRKRCEICSKLTVKILE